MTSTHVFVPGAQQADALEAIEAWYRDEHSPQVFYLAGFAGCGKTTLARHVVERLRLRNVCYAAYTGKAAHVMATRGGCAGASTIHSLIYRPLGADDAELTRLRGELAVVHEAYDGSNADEIAARRTELMALIAAEQRKPRKLAFGLSEESELAGADLLVLDECSMVNGEIAADLLSFGVKILVLGDPAQLPPVAGAGFFTDREPDRLLTEVHRTALDSPITRIATSIRAAVPGDAAVGVPGADGTSGRFRGVRNLLAYDQVICGTNRTRWQLINRIRDLSGHYGPRPVPGDRIIILANSREANVFNGQQWHVLTAEVDQETRKVGEKYLLQVRGDDGEERLLRVWAEGFVNAAGERSVTFSGRGLTAAATFAQAITCHKAQGSEAPKVLVVDESGVFRSMRYKDLTKAGQSHADATAAAYIEGRRWLYTAVTRASERVSIVLPQAVLSA